MVTSACGSSAQEGPGFSESGEAPLDSGLGLPGAGDPQEGGAAQAPPGAAEGAGSPQVEEGVFNVAP